MKWAYPGNHPITWTVKDGGQENARKQQDVDFNLDINHHWNPEVKRVNQNPDSTSATALKKLIPDYDITYKFSVN